MVDIKTILLVEDDPNDVELILEGLARDHLANEVVVARDGAEALDYLYCQGNFQTRSGGNPAVVLLDIKLPKVNGMEVLRTIKGDPWLKQVPVVMLTSSREERDLLESYANGVNAYVVKPVEFQELVKAVTLLGSFWAILNEPPPGSVRKT